MELMTEIPLPPSASSMGSDTGMDSTPIDPSRPPPENPPQAWPIGGYVLARPAAVSAGAELGHHSTSAERLLAISRLHPSTSLRSSLSVYSLADERSSGDDQGEKPSQQNEKRDKEGDKDIKGDEHDTGSDATASRTVRPLSPRTPTVIIAIDNESERDVSLLSAFQTVLELSKEVTEEWPASDRHVLPEIYDGNSAEASSEWADLLLTGKWVTIPRDPTLTGDTDDEDSDSDSSDDEDDTPVKSDKEEGLHSTHIFGEDRVAQVEEAVWRRTTSDAQDLWAMFVAGPFCEVNNLRMSEAHIGQEETYKRPLFATQMPEPDDELLNKMHETDCAPGLNDPVFMMVSSFSILGFRSMQFDMQTVITNRLGSPIIIYVADPGELDDMCSDMLTGAGQPESHLVLARSRCHGLLVLPPAKLISAGVTYSRLVLHPMEGDAEGTGGRYNSAVIGAGWSYQLLSLGPAFWEVRHHWTDSWAEQIAPVVDVCVHRSAAELRNDYRMAQFLYRTTGCSLSRVFDQIEQGQRTERATRTRRAVQEAVAS